MYQYMDGCLRVNQQGSEAGEYTLVTSIEDALKIISENTVSGLNYYGKEPCIP